jgi:hypothetical protein
MAMDTWTPCVPSSRLAPYLFDISRIINIYTVLQRCKQHAFYVSRRISTIFLMAWYLDYLSSRDKRDIGLIVSMKISIHTNTIKKTFSNDCIGKCIPGGVIKVFAVPLL